MSAAEHMNIGVIRDASRVETTCKICNSKSKYVFSLNTEHGKPYPLDIFLCSYCGLLFVGTPITNEQLAHAYGTLDQTKYYQQIEISTGRKVSRAINDLSILLENDSGNSSLLDVGCGYGHLLEALSKLNPSVRAVGQELPGESASVCQTKGFKVLTCVLEDISERFSIISLLDVAEHIPHPNRTFSACYSLLKKDGYIYIHTPRRCIWDNLFLGLIKMPILCKLSRMWFRTRLSMFHLHLWTDEALKLSLQKAGFQLVYLKSEMELSWPLEMYVKVYLGKTLHFSPVLIMMGTVIARVLFVWLRTLKNKAICLGKKRGDNENGG